MNKIEELIQQYCPSGVKYSRISEITNVLRGKRLVKSQLNDDFGYPVFHGGIQPIGYYNKSNRESNLVMVINVGASAGQVGFSNVKFWSSDGCFVLGKSDLINSRFLFYFLSNNQNLITSKVRNAGIPTLDNKILENFIVPTPPLKVQEEIVRILDTFSEYSLLLKSELEARKKQYEYYRNSLLNFEDLDNHLLKGMLQQYCPNGVEYKKIGDLQTELKIIIGDGNYSSKYPKNQELINAGVPFISANNIGGVFIRREGLRYISSKMHSTLTKGHVYTDDVLITVRGIIGRIGYINEEFTNSNINAQVVFLRANKKHINAKFLYFILNSSDIQMLIKKLSSIGAQPQLTIGRLSTLKFPLPPLKVQEEIVRILDTFSEYSLLLNNEIEARQKQFEYYRNKLLTFKEVSS